jgi:hypothetical protein
MIDVVDNFLSDRDHDFVMNYCVDASYFYGEADNKDTPVTGLVHNIWVDSMDEESIKDNVIPIGCVDNKPIDMKEFFDIFTEKIEERYEKCEKKYLSRLYINCFAPGENPYFHRDVGEQEDGLTFLYYPHFYYDIDNGGETQFEIDRSLYGIQPFPNRLVCFQSNILHKATSYRENHRFTVAIKYEFS